MTILNERHQTATYWGNPVSDGMGGNSYNAPKTLAVRWQEQLELFKSPSEESRTNKAKVWVGEKVDIGGYLLLGTSNETDPTVLNNAFKISNYVEIPSVDGSEVERMALL